MSTPLEIVLKFGGPVPPPINIDPMVEAEFKQRCIDLLTGAYLTEADNTRCILLPLDDPDHPRNQPGFDMRDSVCVGVDLGPISISKCWDTH
ncbi:MAG: hypothetical protein ACKOVA_01160 [Novosphingobium sp.]